MFESGMDIHLQEIDSIETTCAASRRPAREIKTANGEKNSPFDVLLPFCSFLAVKYIPALHIAIQLQY